MKQTPLKVEVSHPESDPPPLAIPPILELGDIGDRVREVQATLNRELAGQTIELPRDFRIVEPDPTSEPYRKLEKLGKSIVLRVSDAWASREGPDGAQEILFSRTDPALKVDGVYGQQTFAAILLFQVLEGLHPTGELDAVTLDRLQPTVPPSWLLAGVMNWLQRWSSIRVADAWLLKQLTAVLVTLMILVAAGVILQVFRVLSNSTAFLSRWLFTPENSPWLTTLREKHFFLRMAHFAPAIFIYCAAAVFPLDAVDDDRAVAFVNVFHTWNLAVSRLGLAYGSFVLWMVAQAFVNAVDARFARSEEEGNPVKGIIGASHRIVVIVGILLVCASLAGRNPMYLVGGLGALMAIIMLVFRDTLLGLVASVQIVAQELVQIGDWIEVPSHGVDGTVESITLTTIKVRNFDKTVATIPTHAMLTESVKNWRGMQEVGGRRIKRSILVDMKSVRPVDAEMADKFEAISLIRDYIAGKREELRDHVLQNEVELSSVNGRWLTNLGTYRVYLKAYLDAHPEISGELTCLVRQMPPTGEGLPLEIYCFTVTTDWAEYERIQADVFDHAISIMQEFGLRVYQNIAELDHGAVEQHPIRPFDVIAVALGISSEDFHAIQVEVAAANERLLEQPRASLQAAERKLKDRIADLGLDDHLTIVAEGRTLRTALRGPMT